jgi:hypothetical protein
MADATNPNNQVQSGEVESKGFEILWLPILFKVEHDCRL